MIEQNASVWKNTFLFVSVCHSDMQLNEKSIVLFDFEHFNRKLKHTNCNYLKDFPWWEIPGWKKNPFSWRALSEAWFLEGQKNALGPLAHSLLSLWDALPAAGNIVIHVLVTRQLHPKPVTLYPSLLINCSALDATLQFHPIRACCRLITTLQ